MDQSFTINRSKRLSRNSHEYERGYKKALDEVQFPIDMAIHILRDGDKHSNDIADKLEAFINQS